MTLPLPLRHFLADERGSVSVEAFLVTPMLFWAYLATYVFFDGFRDQSLNVKAAYTIGDILSRQTDYITPEFLDSMYALQGVLNDTPETRRLRVTTFKYVSSNNQYQVIWSQGRSATPLTTASLATMRSRLPVMANGEVAVLTETWMNYKPPMNIGIPAMTFGQLVVTRPRFALNNRFCWNTVNDGGTPSTETC